MKVFKLATLCLSITLSNFAMSMKFKTLAKIVCVAVSSNRDNVQAEIVKGTSYVEPASPYTDEYFEKTPDWLKKIFDRNPNIPDSDAHYRNIRRFENLFSSARAGDAEAIQAALDHGASKYVNNYSHEFFCGSTPVMTPLHEAIKLGSLASVQTLVAAGADANYMVKGGIHWQSNALDMAASLADFTPKGSERRKIWKYLLDQGVKYNTCKSIYGTRTP